MKRIDRKWFPALAVALAVAACSGVPSGVIGPERMARVMADTEVAGAYVEYEPGKFRGDSMKMVLLQSVYARNGVTVAEVDTSLAWYGRHIDRYSEVMKRAVEMLEEDEEKARVAAGGRRMATADERRVVSADGDSVDVWTLPRLWRISRTSPAALVRFNLSRDRNWEPGDGYELRFKAVGSASPVNVVLAADYPRDRRTYITRSLHGDGWQSVSLQLDSAYGASQLYGYIGYTPVSGETLVIDSVMLVRSHWKPGRTKVPAMQITVGKR